MAARKLQNRYLKLKTKKKPITDIECQYHNRFLKLKTIPEKIKTSKNKQR